jgi:tRNA (cmo5U34)-methyltransferase
LIVEERMPAGQSLPKYVGPAASSLGRKMTPEEIKSRFDVETAAAYSQQNPPWLPNYAGAMDLVLQALKLYLPSTARIIDLGAGTGNLSRRVLQAFPDCHLTLVDFSQNMLDGTAGVLAGFEGRYELLLHDMWNIDFQAGAYDAVVASFALHHGRGETVYKKMYQNIFRWLKTPGVFACCDVVNGDAPSLSDINEAGWRQFLVHEEFSAPDIERLFANYHREDSPLSLKQHLNLLSQVGFASADVLWKKSNFSVYVGIKS